MHTQAPGYLALLYGRARTLASVDLTPANGFSGPTASGCAGVAGVAGSTLATPPPRDIGLFTSTGPSNLTALSARARTLKLTAKEGCSLKERPYF